MRKVLLLGFASLLLVREVMHFSEPFPHNSLDTFVDILFGVAIVLVVANAFGFRKVSWMTTVGPCLAALVVSVFLPHQVLTPGFRMARWAEQSPWHGFQPPVLFIDVDPGLILGADLLVFTTAFSVALVCFSVVRSTGTSRAKAA